MNSKSKKKRVSIVALGLAFVMILGASMAYFSDRVSTSENGEAGTLGITLDDSNINMLNTEGKDILDPGDKRAVNFDVTNTGNKSADIRTTIKLTSSVPMSTTGQAEYELYAADDVEEVAGEGWKPKSGKSPITVRSISQDGKTITYAVPEYVLNGNTSYGDNKREIESGVTSDTYNYPYVLICKTETGNTFQDSTVQIEILTEAKQHRNLSDWNVVSDETYTFQNGNTQSTVKANQSEQNQQGQQGQQGQEQHPTPYLVTGFNLSQAFMNNGIYDNTHENFVITDIEAPASVTTFDVSKENNGSVVAWEDGDTVYISSQVEGNKVVANSDCSWMFIQMPFRHLDLKGLDTSEVTNMNYMFGASMDAVSIDASGWDTSNVTDMSSMFDDCPELTSVDLSGWDTSNVENMSEMFCLCPELRTIYVSDAWSTEDVTSSNDMFSACDSLPNYDSSVDDKTHADYSATGYLTYKAFPSN